MSPRTIYIYIYIYIYSIVAESKGKLPHILIPSKTATLVPEFAVEDLPLDRIFFLGSCTCSERSVLVVVGFKTLFNILGHQRRFRHRVKSPTNFPQRL